MKFDYELFENKALASNTNLNSTFIYVGDVKNCCIQFEYTATSGTINGDFYLECSNGKDSLVPTLWTEIEDSLITVTAQASGTVTYNIKDIGYNYVRVVFKYDTTSGPMLLNGRAVLKT